jgi:hypothetical protein
MNGCASCKPSPTVMLEPDPTLTWVLQGAVPASLQEAMTLVDEVVDGAALGVRCRGW